MCKTTQIVWNYTIFVKLHILCDIKLVSFLHFGKFYTWLKFFTQLAVVMVVTNMRCDCMILTWNENNMAIARLKGAWLCSDRCCCIWLLQCSCFSEVDAVHCCSAGGRHNKCTYLQRTFWPIYIFTFSGNFYCIVCLFFALSCPELQ